MEGQGGHENPLQLMPLNFCENANDVPYGTDDDPNQHFVMGAGRSENQPHALPLHHWIYCQKSSHNYVEFFAENSTFLNKTPPDLLESIPSSVGGTYAADGVSETQREFLYSNQGKASGSKPADSPLDMDAWKVRFLKPHNAGEPVNKFTCSQPQTHAQNHAPWTQEPNEDNRHVSPPHPRVTVAVPGFLSKPRDNPSRQRAAATDRHRRIRIAERLKALQELLPHTVEGSQASVLDDIIDHIKFMQFQIKELSRSRLGGESTSGPFIFLEGYGHYILHEQMINEPLEEMMGKLLEMDPSAAAQLLERRGLSVMPMALVEGLR